MREAYEMAVDALGLSITSMEESGEKIPEASSPENVKAGMDAFLMVVEFDLMEYRRKHCSRAVKKTLSIPEWLNEAAVKQEINFHRCFRKR